MGMSGDFETAIAMGATHVRIGSPMATHILFGVYLGVAMWAGLFLRDSRVRALVRRIARSNGDHYAL